MQCSAVQYDAMQLNLLYFTLPHSTPFFTLFYSNPFLSISLNSKPIPYISNPFHSNPFWYTSFHSFHQFITQVESIALIVAHSKAFLEQHPQGLILLGAYNIGMSPLPSSLPLSCHILFNLISFTPLFSSLISFHLISSSILSSSLSAGKERVICELQDTLGLTVYMEESKLQVRSIRTDR